MAAFSHILNSKSEVNVMPVVRIGNIEMYYEVTGEGPPLLLIHGLGSSTRDWECQVPEFSKHFMVITVDVRGHGKTDRPAGPYSIELFASDIALFLKEIASGPAHVLGLSMGGMIAFQLALDNPELVKSLVIVNSGPELVPKGIKEKFLVKQRILIVRLMGMRRLGKFLWNRLLPEDGQSELRKIFEDRWAENDKSAYLASFKALVGWSVVDRISGIRCAVLVVSADSDYTPVSVKEDYVAKIPGAALTVIKNSRHLTPFDQAEEFNGAVLGFLKGV